MNVTTHLHITGTFSLIVTHLQPIYDTVYKLLTKAKQNSDMQM